MDTFQSWHVALFLEHVAPPVVVFTIGGLLSEQDWMRPSATEFLELPWFTGPEDATFQYSQ